MPSLVPCVVLTVAACAGCSYDWTLGTEPRDASVPVDAKGEALDAVADRFVEAGDARAVDARADAPSVADCAALRANIDTTRTAAKVCTSAATDCKTMLEDQCMCTEFVAQPSSSATAAYEGAIGALRDSGCPAECPTCPPVPTESFCLPNSMGTGLACNP